MPTTHGLSHTTTYEIWGSMIKRCENPKAINYHRYGGRGITVCSAWRKSFEAFVADMGMRPSRNHTVERIDNDGPYSPQNCRWATYKEQAQNRRPNSREHILTKDGIAGNLTFWARRLGMTDVSLYLRLKRGWTLEEALTIPRGRYPLAAKPSKHY